MNFIFLIHKTTQVGSSSKTTSILNNDEIYLWHFRLGHPSFYYLKRMFPHLFDNKDPSSFKCEICAFAKLHKSVYSPQQHNPSTPFSLIHSDIWGSSRITTCFGKRWFITFIDDHTRTCWVYLLKDKSEVKVIFKNFLNMVENQFHTRIQILRSDNGREYFTHVLGTYFSEKGIVQQSSCTNSPQQNGVAERKNRHLLEVTRALMFSMNVPKYLWGDPLLHATYLINRMPSKILNFKTPINMLHQLYPQSRLFHSLPLYIFGCTVFIRNPDKHASKLDPKGTRCVFLGIASNKKGYKCFIP